MQKNVVLLWITLTAWFWVLPAASASTLPQLSVAKAATLVDCGRLAADFTYTHTKITAATLVPAGVLANGGQSVEAHCHVTGKMNERQSAVDGQTYAIAFEMRLPKDWSGRFLYQANGGTDGNVVTADGGASMGSGGLLRNGLQMGFAVISSDSGHTAAQNPLFGLDPQARLDYGYMAIGTLTPMAKAVIQAAYGKAPDRSYIAGTSNGGRQALVAASRYADAFDGVLAQSPGINLPRAALANLANAKLWSAVTTTQVVNGQPDFESALPQREREVVATAILDKCDALDGLKDGLVQDLEACRTAFAPMRDIPVCAGVRDGTCLSAAQKSIISQVFLETPLSAGEKVYTGFPFDPGMAQSGWAEWKFRSALRTERNPVSVGYIFSSPPVADPRMARDSHQAAAYALNFNLDTDGAKIFATSGVYSQNSTSFMTAPNATRLDALRNRGAKLLMIHGTADPIFSADDAQAWYRGLDENYQGSANAFARLFFVPGMGHSRGGPATDQYNALGALVDWVEHAVAPDRIVASVRGVGNAGGVNRELPTDWTAQRGRPLCPYPLVARYQSGDPEVATSFQCRP